jgi:transposase
MKVDWELYKKIRNLQNKNVSIRAMSRELGVHRSTITRYCKGEFNPDTKKTHKVEDTALKIKAKELIKEYIDKSEGLTIGKHSLHITNIYREISKKINISYTATLRYFDQLYDEKKEVYLPLIFEPGEVMQVDWYEIKAFIEGVLHKIPVFTAVLGFSNAIYTMVTPNMQQECFISGHIEAMSFFNGVPKKVFYDNVTTATKLGVSKNAVLNDQFKKFAIHYGFEPKFMNVNKGNEKGIVENACKYTRKISFTPIVSAKNLKELQEQNIVKYLSYIKHHRKVKEKNTIYDNLQFESKYLSKLPASDFYCFGSINSIVNKESLIRYDNTQYSVPEEYVNSSVNIKATAYTIECWHKGKLIASHARGFKKTKPVYDPHHYINTLLNKPRAIQNAAPLTEGILSDEILEFIKKVRPESRNKLVFDVLLLERKYGEDVVKSELMYVNLLDEISFKTLKTRLILNHTPILHSRVNIEDLTNIQDQNFEPGSLNDYGSLFDSESEPCQDGVIDEDRGNEDDYDDKCPHGNPSED